MRASPPQGASMPLSATDAPAGGRRRFWYRAQREWLVLVLLLAALALWNGPIGNGLASSPQPDPTGQAQRQGLLTQIDLGLYDFFLKTSAQRQSDAVVIVAIDDASIDQIGRWPWRRPITAELIARVHEMQPAMLAVDIVFAEASPDPRHDEILAAALDQARPILAVARQPFGSHSFIPLYPAREFSSRARLAQVVMAHGADGRIRGLYAREAYLPALSLALVDPSASPDPKSADAMLIRGQWTREGPLMPQAISETAPKISAAAVLRGEVDPAQIRGRRVLIGTTAVGIGDNFSTPLILDRTEASGVELHALATSAQLEGRLIQPIHPLSHALLTVSAVISLMVLLFRTAPEYSLPICAAAILLVLALTALAFYHDLWFQPAGLLMAFVLAYPLWSWRRLSAAAAGLLRHARRLEAVPSVLVRAEHGPRSAEPIARDLGRLSEAATQVRLLNRFLLDGLESLPHPVLIAEPGGRILFRNRRMTAAFIENPPAIGGNASVWFESVFQVPLPAPRSPTEAADSPGMATTPTTGSAGGSSGSGGSGGSGDPGDSGGAGPAGPAGGDASRGQEHQDSFHRSWLVSLNWANRAGDRPPVATDGRDPVRAAIADSGERWLLQLVDVTALRAAEREREEAISFLSHDLRSPQVSILAMANSEGSGGAIDHSALRRHAQRALELTDEFLAFARAGARPIQRQPYDLVDLLTEVADLSWDRAHKAGVRISQVEEVESAVMACDDGMIRRALLNLVENAIRHTGTGTAVTLRLADYGREWALQVEDEGPGIAPKDLASLFTAWWQVDRPAGPALEGRGSSGLGLAMVQRTVSRHGGTVSARNRTQSRGALFEIRLPKAAAGIIFAHGTVDDRTESRDRPLGHP